MQLILIVTLASRTLNVCLVNHRVTSSRFHSSSKLCAPEMRDVCIQCFTYWQPRTPQIPRTFQPQCSFLFASKRLPLSEARVKFQQHQQICHLRIQLYNLLFCWIYGIPVTMAMQKMQRHEATIYYAREFRWARMCPENSGDSLPLLHDVWASAHII